MYDDQNGDYPKAWIFGPAGEVVGRKKDEDLVADGETVSGSFVRLTRASIELYGRRPPIIVLEIDGEPRSLWLTQTVLFNQFRDELADRPNQELEPGERITITRGLLVQPEDRSKKPYQSYATTFHDSPALDTSVLFGLEREAAATAASSSEPVEDDIPF